MNTEDDNGEMKVKDEGSKTKRIRAPYLFPAYDFAIANLIASKVEQDGAGTLSEESLAIALRLSAKSSGFQLKALTARQFGLLTKQGDTLWTTPRAKAIVKPTTADEKRKALMDSFLEIPLFRAVTTRFKGTSLPQGQPFRNVLEREFGVPSKRVSDAERVLMDSARQTGVLVTAGNNMYLSTETELTSIERKELKTGAGQPIAQTAYPPTTKLPSTPSGILTISEEDLATFDDAEFGEVWDALGKIIRARGRRREEKQNKINQEENYVEE
jgi:hypothetical protein